jgi:hypothetical protein
MFKQAFRKVVKGVRSVSGDNFKKTVKVYPRDLVRLSAGIGWLTIAFVNACLAELKGKNKMHYFLASIPLGPLVTPYIVLLKNEVQQVSTEVKPQVVHLIVDKLPAIQVVQKLHKESSK